MPRRAPMITQADIARAIRAAKQAGAGAVEVRRDGSLMIHIQAPEPPAPKADLDHAGDMVF